MHKTGYDDLCMSSTELDMNKPETIPEFRRRALAIVGFLVKAEQFEKEWGACFSHSKEASKCGGSQGDAGQCKRAANAYKASFKESVDFYLDKVHPQKLAQMDTYAGKGQFAVVHSMVRDSIKSVGLLQTLTKEMPTYSHRASELHATMKQLVGIEKIAETNANKIIAATRCPKGKGNKKSVLKTLRPSVNQFFASGSPQAVKRFSLTDGKKIVTTTKSARKKTTEAYAAHACTEGISAATNKPLCQVFSISVKRSKIAGQPWSSWTTFVGDSKSMLCKNLK